jgi:hypothetical protein
LFIYSVALTCIFDLIVVYSVIVFRLPHVAQDMTSWSIYIETLNILPIAERTFVVEVTNKAN